MSGAIQGENVKKDKEYGELPSHVMTITSESGFGSASLTMIF